LSTTAIFLALLVGVIVWILVVRRLTAKSWESRGQAASASGADVESGDVAPGDVGNIGFAPAKLGLTVFLAVVTSLFGLFFSAYSMRMHHGHDDWTHISEPSVLWVNTVMLVLASVALERARSAGRKGQARDLKIALVAAGVFTFAFLGGQLAAWQELSASGQFMTSGPALAFFYLLTAVHGLHVLGGLLVWGKTTGRLLGGAEIIDVRLSVDLCALYWHFLLLVWLVLFSLLLFT
jgi:cytochrome c oxidase subunit III